jgi:hypothetical protein
MSKFFEIVVDFLNGLKIGVSPLLIGGVLGGLFYLFKPDMTGIIMGGFITLIGLIVGIFLAIHIQKTKGTTEFMSGINATPDLDPKDAKEEI